MSNHKNGKTFYKWFQNNKSETFAPVRQRTGLGCPPAKFTTNRSECTNSIIQDYAKRKYGHRLFDIFTFAVMMKKLVGKKEKEVKLVVVDRGGYTLHPDFERLKVAVGWLHPSAKTAVSITVRLFHLVCQKEEEEKASTYELQQSQSY